MPLSVLSDNQIRDLLEDLTPEELESFRGSLKTALHDYSVGTQSRTPHDDEQPERQVVYSAATGTKTLFMPSHGPPGYGVKVITLTSPQPVSSSKSSRSGSGSGSGSPEDAPAIPVVRPTGAITLFSPRGDPTAILHASQLTAFRTALASLCLLQRRGTVRVLTAFGAGLQAYYHIRLALKARGATIKRVNIINHRYSESFRSMVKRFWVVPDATKRREGWADCQFEVLTPGYVEYDRLLKEHVRAADVIFCCTPSTTELFPATHLTSVEGRRKGRLLVAIGSYTPDMAEIPSEVLRQATKRHRGNAPHFHKHAAEGGVVVVDTLDGALKEAGEIIAAGLLPDHLVELGELVMLQRDCAPDSSAGGDGDHQVDDSNETPASPPPPPPPPDLDVPALSPGLSAMSSVFGFSSSRASSRGSSPSRQGDGNRGFFSHKRTASSGSVKSEAKTKDDQLALWLQTGNVIYKSVGMGLMDLTIGSHLVAFAKEKGVGTHVEDF